MGYINLGGQTVVFAYKNPTTGRSFSTLLRGGVDPGIISGGVVTVVDNSTVEIAAFSAYLDAGSDKCVKITTQTPVQVTVSSGSPIVYATYSWQDVIQNYADFYARADNGSPVTNEVKFCKAIYTGGTLTSVDMTETYRNTSPAPTHESEIVFTDITTGDVSTTKHGYVPKAPGDSQQFLNGATGTWGPFNPKQQITLMQPYQLFGDIKWKNTTQLVINPKIKSGLSWIGAILNDGTYLELSSTYTVDTAVTGDGGLLDGLSLATNSWYILWAYKAVSDNTLKFGLSFMPCTTLNASNPTNSLALKQINSTNIGYLFPANAQLVLWNGSAKYETPLYNTSTGFDPSISLSVLSCNDTTLSLSRSLSVTNFSVNDYVYAVSGFKPVSVANGSIAATIGSNGYVDTGIRIRTDGSGYIMPFIISGNKFLFTNGTGSADGTGFGSYTQEAALTVHRELYIPPDKTGAFIIYITMGGVTYTSVYVSAPYYHSYGEYVVSFDSTTGFSWASDVPFLIDEDSKSLHQLHKSRGDSDHLGTMYTRGYLI